MVVVHVQDVGDDEREVYHCEVRRGLQLVVAPRQAEAGDANLVVAVVLFLILFCILRRIGGANHDCPHEDF